MKYFLDPFGCVKNQVDAENMMAHLNNAGWESTADNEQADLIIVNSCGFIESAKQESIDAVIEWRRLFANKKILLAGCLSQRYEKELKESLTEADGFLGVGNPSQIVEKANNFFQEEFSQAAFAANSEKNLQFEKPIFPSAPLRLCESKIKKLSQGERPLLSLPGSAYVKISEGCNNNCSYCAIPLIRGKLVCRIIDEILDECRTLISRGIKELCIIGQDIGAYGNEEKRLGLTELLEAISTLEGDFWVRLLYIHPNHFPLEILDLMEKDPRFLPYFDIPFQHASEKILTSMNRIHSSSLFPLRASVPPCDNFAKEYLELLKTIRARLPDAVIRSTFMLGFPGETEEDFNELLDFQQKANLDWLGCFTYSREEGTASYSMKGRVPVKTAEKRKQLIEEKQISITEKNMDRFIGQIMDVLIEEQLDARDDNDEESETIWLGRLFCQAPDIDGAAVIVSDETGKKLQTGTFAKCKVIARRGFDLEVRVLSE
ncbi:MAG: 30S ribosomal protein S12 methylthiotransferase RimO [Treponema sp.]|nr:30S ribosomal protein S12 methylthiotransferase RimO [Treponema sp.]